MKRLLLGIAVCVSLLLCAFGASALEYLDLNMSTVGLYDNFNRPDGVVGTFVYPSYALWSVGGDASALISSEAFDINLAGASYALIWSEFYVVNTSHTVTWELDINTSATSDLVLMGVGEWGTQGTKTSVTIAGGSAYCVIADSQGSSNPVAIASGMQHWKIIFYNEAPDNYSISAYQNGVPICVEFSEGFPQYMKDANYIAFGFFQQTGETIVDNYLVYNGTVQPYSSMGVPPPPSGNVTSYVSQYQTSDFTNILKDFFGSIAWELLQVTTLIVAVGIGIYAIHAVNLAIGRMGK